MKKLMFAAAVMAAGAAMAVESQVVGYLDKQHRDGSEMHTVCFNAMTTNAMDIVDIGVSGYPEEECYDMIYIQILDEVGVGGPIYQFIDYPGEGLEKGWYDGLDLIPRGEVILPQGQGLWTTSIADAKFTFNGQVEVKDCTFELREGSTGIGNMMAVPVDLTDVLVEGYPEEECYDMIYVQILDEVGVGGPIYQFIDYPGEGLEKGWYDGLDPLAKDAVVLNPGDGLWATMGVSGVTFTFPAPEL